jgi:hypothetical protein
MDGFDEELLNALDRLGFEGLDASFEENLTCYGGMWSERHEVAFLTEVEVKDPGIRIIRLTAGEIDREVEAAGPGFASFTDVENCGVPGGMSAVQSLMLYNGGWHQDCRQWQRMSDWTTGELVSRLKKLCDKQA